MSCIVGDCPICDDLIYETEWSGPIMEIYGVFVHEEKCQAKFFQRKKQQEEIDRLKAENEELRKQLTIGQLSLDI